MKQINSVTLGILFMLAFAIIGPLIDLFAKLASAEVPIGQIILSRFILQGFVLLPVAIILSLAHRPTFKEFQMHFKSNININWNWLIRFRHKIHAFS